MMIVSDATTWSINYDRKSMARANKTYIVEASLTIVNYDHQNIFTVQATV